MKSETLFRNARVKECAESVLVMLRRVAMMLPIKYRSKDLRRAPEKAAQMS